MGISDLCISSPKYEFSTSDYNEASNITSKKNIERHRKREEYFKMVNEKIVLYRQQTKDIPFEKVPIKYSKEKIKNNRLVIVFMFEGLGICEDFTELFRVEKIKTRYYCCKNRIDLWNKVSEYEK